jgi:hypothetical protein
MAYKILGNAIPIIDDSRNVLNATAIGIGTTNPLQKLWVEGNSYFTGVTTASQFVSNVAQGTAPISVASSTLVSNLNAQYLNGQSGAYYNSANNLTGTAPGSVISQSNGLTVTGNLNVSGNVSVAGSSFLLNAQSLRITDRDITLGVATDANGNDISTDTTANHGGIAIASTEGSPILNIPSQAGINTDPSTYKQLMWIKQGNYSGMGTDAWTFNYAVSIGNTASVQNLSRLTVGAGFTVYDTYLDALDIRARNITTVNNINASGIVTAANGFNASSSSDYEINGTSVLNSTTLGSGVVNSSLTSVGTLTQLNVTGVSTLGNIYSTGIHTAATYYVGTTKIHDTISGQVTLSGIATIDATTRATLERELAFAPNDFDSLNVSGISTLRSTTIIGGGTSTGTVGQVLQVTGISSGAYIGGSVGIGTTNPQSPLDVNGNARFRAALIDNNGVTGAASSVLTAGTGGQLVWAPVVSGGGAAIAGINVTQDDTGVRYPLLASGANATTTAQYVDATALVYNTSTNCLGIGSLTPTSKLDIIGDIKITGIITAGDFNSASDKKLKTNIEVISNPIEKVLQINGVSFNWKESGKATMGVIAQEVEKVIPELVSDTDPKTVNYNGLIGLLIECVKDQQRQIDELKNIT